MRRLFALGLLALLAACAPVPKTAGALDSPAQTTPAAEDKLRQAQSRVQDSGVIQAATQPLSDLNLIQTAIPPVLTRAQLGGAYTPPADPSCAALQVELLALDTALGPDIDAAGTPDAAPGLMGKTVDFVGDAAMDSVRGSVNAVVDGVIPLRSWVRKLSGAERHSKAVAAAIAAGTLRRPYLKGWASAQGCIEGPWPARPVSP